MTLLSYVSWQEGNLGYNAQTNEYVDTIANGIIDPTLVVRTALPDAASIALLMTTTECVIVDMPEKKNSGATGDDLSSPRNTLSLI